MVGVNKSVTKSGFILVMGMLMICATDAECEVRFKTIFGMAEDEAIAALGTVPEEIIRRGSENRIMGA